MTYLHLTCMSCGDTHLTPADITVDLTGPDPVYRFTHCHLTQERLASARQVQVLEVAGCRVERPVPAFTFGDVLKMRTLMERVETLADIGWMVSE